MALLRDKATIRGDVRITREGYLIADAYVAQAGNIQTYTAGELGLKDRAAGDVLRVYRPEAEVFAADSIASASRLPITLDHPKEMVDARNWREFAKGETGEEIMRDGQYMRVPLRVTDASAVASVQTDRQEFSLGYTCDVKFEAGVTDAGEAYDATATGIRYNHLAACRTARGGPQLRIVDERPAPKGERKMPFVIVDGLPVDTSNAEVADAAVRNLVTARDTAVDAVKTATTTIAARDATIAAKDSEIATLKDQLEKAKPTPAQLRDAAAGWQRAMDKAKALGAAVTDAMDHDTIVSTAVRHRLGDKAKDYTPAQHAAAFDALEAPAKGTQSGVRDALADVVGHPATIGDAATQAAEARTKRFDRYATAHSGRTAAAA
jgi:uncharacterized protein